MNRRCCLKVLGFGGAWLLCSGFAIKPGFGLESRKKKLKTYSITLPLMNTFVEITVMDSSYQKACEAAHRAFSKMKRLTSILNRFDPASQVGWLNQKGYLNDVPEAIYRVLIASRYINRITKGGFDVTVLPVLELTSYYLKNQSSLPDPRLLREALECVGFEHVMFDRRRVRFLRSGVMVTFDGIAKGFIIDEASEELKSFGISHALINAGGDIRAVGGRGDDFWIIGIQDPENSNRIIQKVALKEFAIATSGSYENFFNPRKTHFHIIDKDIGFSPINITSCSVIARTAVLADGLATGLFVSSPEKAIGWINGLEGVEAEIITRGNRVFSSVGWKKFLVL